MSPLPLSTLLLSRPISLSEVKLGRLITDPLYPDDKFFQPAASKRAKDDNTSSCGASPGSASPMKVSVQPFHNFNETLKSARGTRLELSLLSLLSASTDVSGSNTRTIKSPLCFIHEVRNPESYFAAICEDAAVREWIEVQKQRPRTSVYLVCGFKTLTDVTLDQDNTKTVEAEPSVSVPVATIAGAAAGVPVILPDGLGDVSAGMNFTRESSDSVGYFAPGERVYAIQCRKVHFRFFSTKLDGSRLDKKDRNCWVSYLDGRSGDADEEDGVEVELTGSLSLEDAEDWYEPLEAVDIDGEEYVFPVRVDTT